MLRYYVTNRHGCDVLRTAELAIASGIDMIQIREKDLTSSELLDLVRRIAGIAEDSPTRVLVNDRLDIARAVGVSGVHLPQNGLPAASVRPLVDILGVSTHTKEEVRDAEAAGADFVVFGPIFDTPGKTAVGLDRLREVSAAVRIPVLAIGGITEKNTPLVVEAGAAGIAAIRMFQKGESPS